MLGLIIAAVIVAFILLLVFLPLVAYSIIAIVAVTVLVLLIIPIGVNLAYIDNELVLNAKLWFYHYKLLPKTEKTADNKKASDNAKAEQKKKSPHGNNKAKKKLDLSFEEILEIIKKALKASDFGVVTSKRLLSSPPNMKFTQPVPAGGGGPQRRRDLCPTPGKGVG